MCVCQEFKVVFGCLLNSYPFELHETLSESKRKEIRSQRKTDFLTPKVPIVNYCSRVGDLEERHFP